MDFLKDAVDLHVHSSPDIDPRRFDDIELATEAARAGMAALVIKSHQNSTVERAWLASKVVRKVQIFGGLVLNETVGGLNPSAVRVALQLGAKQIWMPTRSAKNHRAHHRQAGGITVKDNRGRLSRATVDILKLIGETDCILGTGHLSPEESVLLVRHARKYGVKKILITHPEWALTFFPVALQRELAASGYVTFERCFVSTTHRGGYTPFRVITDAIADVGVDTTVISTDLGQPDTPPPAEGLRDYAAKLRAYGFSPHDLHRMMRVNPRRLLSI